MSNIGVFPFGQPVRCVGQGDRTQKRVFVLGVYASAVHARWVASNGKQKVGALAVCSEPYIFWRGEDVEKLLGAIQVPAELGHLEPASPTFNGPSGRALDDLILKPLGVDRAEAWLADLVPHSCANPAQLNAIQREYFPAVEKCGLPETNVPIVPKDLADNKRRQELLGEVEASAADLIVLLGDQPLRCFLAPLTGMSKRLSDYGVDINTYGRLHPAKLLNRTINILPLAHPRQIARLGRSSQRWFDLHEHWRKIVAPTLLKDVAAPTGA